MRDALATLFGAGTLGAYADGELLARFVRGRGDAQAEAAFAVLVERHGPLVLGVCRRALGGDAHAADDAFQAVFLVLARKARSVRVGPGGSLGGWLYAVSVRVARRARASTVARPTRSLEGLDVPESRSPGRDRELGEVLDEEVVRLPSKYRSVVVLCLVEGLSQEQAARRLRCPVGTVQSRLHRARERLRSRLARRGFAPAASAFSALDPPAVAPSLIHAVSSNSARFAAGASLAGTVPAAVAGLTRRTLRSMLVRRWIGTAALLAAGLGTGGVVATARQEDAPASKPAPKTAAPSPPTRAERFAALAKKYEDERKAWTDEYQKATAHATSMKDHEIAANAIKNKPPVNADYARKFLALAEEDPADPASAEMLYYAHQVADKVEGLRFPDGTADLASKFAAYREPSERAVALLRTFHAANPKMANYLSQIGMYGNPGSEALARDVLATNPDRYARGHAVHALAVALENKAALAKGIAGKADWVDATATRYGPERLRWAEGHDPDALLAETDSLHERLVKEFADVPLFPEYPEEKAKLAKSSKDWLANRRDLNVGKPAPEFDGTDVEDHKLALKDYRGQVVVLVFWSTWCAYCLDEIPEEIKLIERFKGRPFALLGVNCDYTKAKARETIQALKLDWPNWYDGDMREGPIVAKYHLRAIPAVFLIGPDGVIRGRDLRGEQVDAAVEALFREIDARKSAPASPPGAEGLGPVEGLGLR